jgi:hypothetical protein
MVDTRCRACGKTSEALQRDTGFIDRCSCGGERERLFLKDGSGPRAAHGDYIPGGMTFKHGICNEDGTPKTYYSKRDIRDACKKAGVVPLSDTGLQIPVTDDETARNFERPGYEQATRWPAVPGILTPEMEQERIAHWWAQEALLHKLEHE